MGVRPKLELLSGKIRSMWLTWARTYQKSWVKERLALTDDSKHRTWLQISPSQLGVWMIHHFHIFIVYKTYCVHNREQILLIVIFRSTLHKHKPNCLMYFILQSQMYTAIAIRYNCRDCRITKLWLQPYFKTMISIFIIV